MKRVICFIQVLPLQEPIKVVESELTIGDFQGKGSYSVAFLGHISYLSWLLSVDSRYAE